MRNAKTGEPLDFKDRGINERDEDVGIVQHRYRGSVATSGEIGSARDFGNIAAGIVAGRNPFLSWETARIGFDGLEQVKSATGNWDRFVQENRYRKSEGKPTVLAERLGFEMGREIGRSLF